MDAKFSWDEAGWALQPGTLNAEPLNPCYSINYGGVPEAVKKH
jgi:hypothetical protein